MTNIPKENGGMEPVSSEAKVGGWGPIVGRYSTNEGPTDPDSKKFWTVLGVAGVGAAMGVLGYLVLIPH